MVREANEDIPLQVGQCDSFNGERQRLWLGKPMKTSHCKLGNVIRSSRSPLHALLNEPSRLRRLRSDYSLKAQQS
jgi:hypothetical protein